MKIVRTFAGAVAVVALCLVTFPASANVAPEKDPNEEFRGELAAYFQNLAETSPTLLGKLADDPQTMADIAATIDGLSAEDLQEMRETFANTPNWQVVPEALYSSLSPEMRQRITEEGRAMAAKAADAGTFKTEVARLTTLAGMLPSDGEEGGGVDRASLDVLQQNLSQMHPLQVAGMKDQVAAYTDWQALSTQAMGALPPSVREGLDALATHGSLSADDIGQLEAFRNATVELLEAADALPEKLRAGLELDDLAEVVARLDKATPEMLFLLRDRIDIEAVEEATQAVEQLARAASLTPGKLEQLDLFRSEVAEAFWQGGEQYDPVQERLASLTPEHLFVLQEKLAGHPGWQQQMPTILVAMSDDQVAHQLAQLQDPGADKALMRELEQYRTEMTDQLAMLQSTHQETPSRADAALRVMREATPENLVLMHAVSTALPDGLPADVVADHLLLTNFFKLDLDCITGFGWVCDLIELAISGVTNAINAVRNTVNSIIDGIKNTVTDIWNGILNFPTTIKNALTDLFNLLLDVKIGGYSLRDLTDPAVLKQVLNLGADFWNNIPDIPQLPCPPDGFDIPLFGEVGEGATSAKYEQYKWLFDKLLGLIPDTEISLVVKIPAQIAYAGVEYLGVCLEAAAEARDEQATEEYRASVGQGFATSQSYQMSIINNQVGLFASISALSGQVSDQGTDLSDQIDNFMWFELRLKIEANLIENPASPIGLFQLPEVLGGYLELVRDIVVETIDAMSSAGESIKTADKHLGRGDDYYNQGEYKRAYKEYQKAYQAAVLIGGLGGGD